MTKHKVSKEIVAIQEAVENYLKKHNNKAQFNISMRAFEGEDFDVVDDFISSYGIKTGLIVDLKEHLKALSKEPEDFINW